MSRLAVAATILLLVAAVIWGRPAGTQAANDAAPDSKALLERVEALEKTVVKDPYHPKDTVLARLDAIEATLKMTAKVGEQATKVDGKEDQQIKRTIEVIQKDLTDVTKRLKAVEAAKPAAVGAENAGDIKELRRTVDQLSRSLDDLKGRVARLEAKR